MRLNQIDIPGRAAATGYDDIAFGSDVDCVIVEVIGARLSVRCAPMSGVDTNCAPFLVDDCVDAEGRIDERRDTLALFMNGVAVKQSRADAGAPAAMLKIERQHVRGRDRFR